ncbi:coenzyme F420-dependent NADP oxidoreductase [Corynebacterium suranareeae]|uniref:Coenzyme F420-dependent NADP oxidoreductase n=1 Tax=Corynebacterium suranareeae TaxID=2506452 RepID=A0A160PUV2_9CORY|nr:NAD(P)-binding domain-containing protein [Corynebacterium suranareeae]BAU96410.1 coenzyme F420-dependent NADP oxidoreductase [Corynebacterium suranareeae]
MTTVGIIGSGNIGGALARMAVAAGYDVIVSNSRGPESLTDQVASLGKRARAATPEEAAREGDLVVAAVGFRHHTELPVEALAGKTVIDTMNYFPEFDGVYPELDAREITSSELVQKHLSQSHVVKVLNNLDSIRLETAAQPAGSPARSALSISANDKAAQAEAAAFTHAIGYDTVENGTLADSWRHEAGTPVNVLPYIEPATKKISEEEFWSTWLNQASPVTVPADCVRDLLNQANRTGRVGGASADWLQLIPGEPA